MQIHNIAAGQTLFAINHWRAGDRADIGIGNQEGQQRDWTFSANAGTYPSKRLRVYIRPKQAQ
jgi:sialate O-acetylesterase